jgi:hypothetical protein
MYVVLFLPLQILVEDIISKEIVEYITVFFSILLVTVSVLNIKMRFTSNNIITFKGREKEILIRIIGLDSILISITYLTIWYLYIKEYNYTIIYIAIVVIYLLSLFRIKINNTKRKKV